jgi:anti-anti-sigma factor
MGIFELTTHNEAQVVRIALTGEFDIASADRMEQELRRVEALEPKAIVIDISQLDFMDSTGLRVILSADARAHKQGHRLCVSEAPQSVQRVFRITGVDERLDIVSDPLAVQ